MKELRMAIHFDTREIYPQLETVDDQGLDLLGFGVVKMDKEGQVIFYNKYESDLSGFTPDQILGKNFFTRVAPCTNNFMIAHKFLGRDVPLDETLDYIFTYRIQPTRVKLRLLSEPDKENQYLLVLKV